MVVEGEVQHVNVHAPRIPDRASPGIPRMRHRYKDRRRTVADDGTGARRKEVMHWL